jgi:ribosomal-protein-alanine N-acetyltransferase
MSSPLTIRTPRLLLIAATQEIVIAERHGTDRLSQALEITVPSTWPHEGIDDSVLAMFERELRDLLQIGWWLWYVLSCDDSSSKRTLIGTCGCVGRPNPRGEVEIGYGLLTEYQGHGYASEAVASLLIWIWSHREVRRVFADVLSGNESSKRLLARLGFGENGPGNDPGTIRMVIDRPESPASRA